MGGAIGTIAAAWEPQLFQKIILNSPMLRPLTGNVPWPLVIAIAQTKCLLGREEDYVAGQKPYDGGETSNSGCTSRPRFEKYNEMRKENKKFQVSAASYGVASGVCKNELVHKILWMEETDSTCVVISGRKR